MNGDFDYHSWKSRIYDESDKILFDEIIKCIDAEAFRAASIMICISFTESLYKKLEILSESNNKITQDLINYKSEGKDFLLVEYAKKYELINELGYNHLMLIMDARNNYAHPNFNSPSETQVISYLHFAVEYVLSKPPYFSFLYAKSLIEHFLVKDQFYFEGKNNIQIRNYARNFFQRLDKSSFKAVLNLLFKSLEHLYLDFNENNAKCIDNCLIYLDELLSREEVVLSEDDFNSYLDKYRYASCHIFTYGNNWNQLDVRSKSRIFNYSINFENGMFSEIEFVKVYYPLYKSNSLGDEGKLKFENVLEELSLDSLLNCNLDYGVYFDKIISYFKSHSWGYQNTAMKSLYKIDLDQFSNLELEEIGRNIAQSADGNAWDCMDLIDYFYEEKNYKFHNINLVCGMVKETFVDEKNHFRYKAKLGRRILILLHQYFDAEKIFNRLLINIESSRPKNDDFIRFNQGKYFLSRLKDKNKFLSSEIDKIISSINKAICNSINSIFDDDYKQILTYNNFRSLTPYVYNCLNETKRKTFSELANEEPLDFIRFFTKVKRYVENNENKIEVNIRFDLFEKFINPLTIWESIGEINLEKLSKVDRCIINEFLNEFD